MCHKSTIAARTAIITFCFTSGPDHAADPAQLQDPPHCGHACDLNHDGSCVINEAKRVFMTPDNRIAGQRFAIPAQQP